MSNAEFVYRLSNSQRMALCTLISEYMKKLSDDRNVLPEIFVDCSVPASDPANDPGIEPGELLAIFIHAECRDLK